MTLERILIVDYESKWVHLLRQILEGSGFNITAAHKGEQAIQLVAKEPPALVLTDACLAGEIDGYELVTQIRLFSEVPVIMLSASTATEDILRGFEAGADDYITKPFDSKILLARVRAVLNRCRGKASAPGEIVCNYLVIDQASRQVTVDGLLVYLTKTEYNLLLELARHINQVMSHEQLLQAVWGAKYSSELDYLRSYIHILRRKLERDPANPKLIISYPGIGYMLVSSSSSS